MRKQYIANWYPFHMKARECPINQGCLLNLNILRDKTFYWLPLLWFQKEMLRLVGELLHLFTSITLSQLAKHWSNQDFKIQDRFYWLSLNDHKNAKVGRNVMSRSANTTVQYIMKTTLFALGKPCRSASWNEIRSQVKVRLGMVPNMA